MAIERQLADLERLAERARHVLEDPRKQKWHQDTRIQLSQIEAEMQRLKEREAWEHARKKAQQQPRPKEQAGD